MAMIKRRIRAVSGLQDALDVRPSTSNAVTDPANATDNENLEYIPAYVIRDQLNLKVNIADIIDDLTTGGSDKPLSAEQGKVLKGLIDGMSSGLEYKGTIDLSNGDVDMTTYASSYSQGDFYKIKGDGNLKDSANNLAVNNGDMIILNKDVDDAANINVLTDIDKIDNTESADLLRQGDVSQDTDFANDPAKIADRQTIKTFVENEIATIDIKPINETVTISGNDATLSHEPLGAIVLMGYVQVDNGDGTFDLVQATVDGTTLTVHPDVDKEYDGKDVTASYLYV